MRLLYQARGSYQVFMYNKSKKYKNKWTGYYVSGIKLEE